MYYDDEIEGIDEDDFGKEDDDPLFGNLKNNEGLKLLLSPTKKQRNKENINIIEIKSTVRRKLNIDEKTDKYSNKKQQPQQQQPTICSFFNKDPLDKELGFSLKNSLKDPKNNFCKSKSFVKLKNDVERNREILKLFNEKEIEESQRELINNEIENWITKNVFQDFLNLENYENKKVHLNWINQLKKSLNDIIIINNNNKFENDIINWEILNQSQYCQFKCFTNSGIHDKKIKSISFLFDEFSIKNIVESIDIEYVESFKPNIDFIKIEQGKEGEEGDYNIFKILKNLGFSNDLITFKSIKLKFDDKTNLPPVGCGFQVYKFVKLIEINKIFEKISKKEIISVLILMIIDYNVNNDIKKFYYRDNYFTGKEIGLLKLKDFKDEIKLINDILITLFEENCPHLWFQLIRNIYIFKKNDQSEKIFKNKLILKFLNNIKLPNDKEIKEINEDFEDFEKKENNNEELFKIFFKILEDMSFKIISIKDEEFLPIILLRIELISDMIINNYEIIKKWKIENLKEYEKLGKTINLIKKNYFKEFENGINSNIPKCKKILDFIYYELCANEVGDFFAMK